MNKFTFRHKERGDMIGIEGPWVVAGPRFEMTLTDRTEAAILTKKLNEREGERTYTIGKSENDRVTITCSLTIPEGLPFAIFRDLGRLCGLSYSVPGVGEVFEFLVPPTEETLAKAERIVQGALFKKKENNDNA